MRLTRLWIDGFRNLKDVTVEFDPRSLTTVIIGQNGSGKSYLLEAIVQIFRNADLDVAPPQFAFALDYLIGGRRVSLASRNATWTFTVDGASMSRSEFSQGKSDFFPDTVFAYYSGTNDRMESHFDRHQQNYYRTLITDTSGGKFKAADISDRRLFYARPIHGVLALLCLLTSDDLEVRSLIKDMTGITGFHSAMLLLRKPWFAKGKSGTDAEQFWGASGRPGRAARLARKHAFYPMAITQRAREDYRSGGNSESQYAIYLRNETALAAFANDVGDDDLALFEELESIDISDLYRSVQVWVTRIGAADGEVSYGEMSEGERQLLMVLGLIRLSRSKRAIFLLDEPDTHLNPRWQYDYLALIEKWAESSGDRCQLLLTTHNPLMVGSLRKEQVRVVSAVNGKTLAHQPDDDPIGIGVEGLLKSELFGLRSTLAPKVLAKIDRHYHLIGQTRRTADEDTEARQLAIELNNLGIAQTHPNPYFEDFAKAMARKAEPSPTGLSKQDIDEQAGLADELLEELLAEEAQADVGAPLHGGAA